MKVGVSILTALIVCSAAAASVPQYTTTQARIAARVLGYPKPGARKIMCKGGPVFRCKAVYRRTTRRFVLTVGLEGGWVCAGRTPHTCHVLPKGFVPASWVTGWGGLEAAATYTADGYIQKHYDVTPQQAGGCNPFGSNAYTCAYSTPSVIVTVTYKKVHGGWTVTAT
ncbi:MAG TPA: hypothetical protein VFH56_10320 [Acidimicrobiales bacterium]|nr:hypothetical protein [Acidimicrobiales bacterium]